MVETLSNSWFRYASDGTVLMFSRLRFADNLFATCRLLSLPNFEARANKSIVRDF